jgi:hypothetical protein
MQQYGVQNGGQRPEATIDHTPTRQRNELYAVYNGEYPSDRAVIAICSQKKQAKAVIVRHNAKLRKQWAEQGGAKPMYASFEDDIVPIRFYDRNEEVK